MARRYFLYVIQFPVNLQEPLLQPSSLLLPDDHNNNNFLNLGSVPPRKRSSTPQVNNLSLRLPAKPLLLDQGPIRRDNCSADGVTRKHCVGDYCECLHTHRVNVGDIVELILINEGQ